MTKPIISIENLAKRYRIGQQETQPQTLRETLAGLAGAPFAYWRRMSRPASEAETLWAIRNFSAEIQPGEAVGIVGRNGSGKSTLLKLLSRITTPTRGRAVIRGRVGSLLEVGTGFHPELTGRENIYLNGSILGMKHRDIQRKLNDIVEFSGVERFIDTPVKRYSSGMYVRLAFSVAAHLEPEILLVDEVLAVGDAEFQQRCLGRMEDLSGTGRTVIFVSHNMQAINQLCDRAILIDGGRIIDDGHPSGVVTRYLQTALGSGSSISWLDDGTGPGDDRVRLLSVRAVDEDGDTVDTADVRRPVGIEIGYRILRDGPPVFAKIKVYDRQGDTAFNAMDVAGHRHDAVPGHYVTTGWIPANLLNEGRVSVEAGIWSLNGPRLLPHGHCHDAVSFHVFDPGDG